LNQKPQSEKPEYNKRYNTMK